MSNDAGGLSLVSLVSESVLFVASISVSKMMTDTPVLISLVWESDLFEPHVSVFIMMEMV